MRRLPATALTILALLVESANGLLNPAPRSRSQRSRRSVASWAASIESPSSPLEEESNTVVVLPPSGITKDTQRRNNAYDDDNDKETDEEDFSASFAKVTRPQKQTMYKDVIDAQKEDDGDSPSLPLRGADKEEFSPSVAKVTRRQSKKTLYNEGDEDDASAFPVRGAGNEKMAPRVSKAATRPQSKKTSYKDLQTDDQENSSAAPRRGVGRDNDKKDSAVQLSTDRTLYEILGASPEDSRAELKKKYAMLAKQTHPDTKVGGSNKDQNEREFREIAAAWRILGDQKERLRYDRSLQAKAFTDNIERMVEGGFRNTIVPFLRKTADTTIMAADATKKATDATRKAAEVATETAASITESAVNSSRKTAEVTKKAVRMAQKVAESARKKMPTIKRTADGEKPTNKEPSEKSTANEPSVRSARTTIARRADGEKTTASNRPSMDSVQGETKNAAKSPIRGLSAGDPERAYEPSMKSVEGKTKNAARRPMGVREVSAGDPERAASVAPKKTTMKINKDAKSETAKVKRFSKSTMDTTPTIDAAPTTTQSITRRPVGAAKVPVNTAKSNDFMTDDPVDAAPTKAASFANGAVNSIRKTANRLQGDIGMNEFATGAAAWEPEGAVDTRRTVRDARTSVPANGQRMPREGDQEQWYQQRQELEQLAFEESRRADQINSQLKSVSHRRLQTVLRTPNSALTSNEALRILERLSTPKNNYALSQFTIKQNSFLMKDIEELQRYEWMYRSILRFKEHETKKASRVTRALQVAQSRGLPRKPGAAQQSALIARTKIEMIREAKWRAEHRRNAAVQDFEQVSLALERRQERVRRMLRSKEDELMGGRIGEEFATRVAPSDIAMLRREEDFLVGERARLEARVRELRSRAEELRSRSEDLRRGDSKGRRAGMWKKD